MPGPKPEPAGPYREIESELLFRSDVKLGEDARAALVLLYNDTVGRYLRSRPGGGEQFWTKDPDFRRVVLGNVHVCSYLLRTRGMHAPDAAAIDVVGREVIHGARTEYLRQLRDVFDCPIIPRDRIGQLGTLIE